MRVRLFCCSYGTMFVTAGSTFQISNSKFMKNRVSTRGSYGAAITHDFCQPANAA